MYQPIYRSIYLTDIVQLSVIYWLTVGEVSVDTSVDTRSRFGQVLADSLL